MSSQLNVSIPEREWKPISDEAKSGAIVFIRDESGTVDIAVWNNGEWSSEFGLGVVPTWFAPMSIDSVRAGYLEAIS